MGRRVSGLGFRSTTPATPTAPTTAGVDLFARGAALCSVCLLALNPDVLARPGMCKLMMMAPARAFASRPHSPCWRRLASVVSVGAFPLLDQTRQSIRQAFPPWASHVPCWSIFQLTLPACLQGTLRPRTSTRRETRTQMTCRFGLASGASGRVVNG